MRQPGRSPSLRRPNLAAPIAIIPDRNSVSRPEARRQSRDRDRVLRERRRQLRRTRFETAPRELNGWLRAPDKAEAERLFAVRWEKVAAARSVMRRVRKIRATTGAGIYAKGYSCGIP